jgi:uncharacterized protein (DUF1697 family)
MGDLRAALEDDGFGEVRTYLQSGNVILASRAKGDDVARKVERLIAKEFGLDISIVVRSRAQLARVVEANPLRDVAKDPKRYQVSFLAVRPPRDLISQLEQAAVSSEQVVVIGREIYAWHPKTIARSRLWGLLAGQQLGVTATARNWTTVTKLLALANER